MYFSRHRLLYKITIVILWVDFAASILSGLILGIIYGSLYGSFVAFVIPFASGIGSAAISLLLILLFRWLLRDFDELDAVIRSTKSSIKNISNNSNNNKTVTPIKNEAPAHQTSNSIKQNDKQNTENYKPKPIQQIPFNKGDIVTSVCDIGKKVIKGRVGIVTDIDLANETVTVNFRTSYCDIIEVVKPYQIKK